MCRAWWAEDGNELPWGDNVYAVVCAQRQEVFVPGHKVVRVGFQGAGDHHVIIGITSHGSEVWESGDKLGRAAEALTKRHDTRICVLVAATDPLVV